MKRVLIIWPQIRLQRITHREGFIFLRFKFGNIKFGTSERYKISIYFSIFLSLSSALYFGFSLFFCFSLFLSLNPLYSTGHIGQKHILLGDPLLEDYLRINLVSYQSMSRLVTFGAQRDTYSLLIFHIRLDKILCRPVQYSFIVSGFQSLNIKIFRRHLSVNVGGMPA